MNYKINKAKYLGHNSKSITVEIYDDNNELIETFEFYGSRKAAKKKAESIIKIKSDENKDC